MLMRRNEAQDVLEVGYLCILAFFYHVKGFLYSVICATETAIKQVQEDSVGNQSVPPDFKTVINSASGVPSSSPRSVLYSHLAVSGSDMSTDSMRTPGV